MRAFVDSDVVISALLSQTGASHDLLHTQNITPIISSLSEQEVEKFIQRKAMDGSIFTSLIKNTIQITPLRETAENLKVVYGKYILDENDAHIVAGAKTSNAKFLITYNLKDFKAGKIKEDFNIIILTPGHFLQYLRSLK